MSQDLAALLKELQDKSLEEANKSDFNAEAQEILVLQIEIEKALKSLTSNFNSFNNLMEKYHRICQEANDKVKEMGDVELLSAKITERLEEIVAKRSKARQ
jgi:hypothetical protein